MKALSVTQLLRRMKNLLEIEIGEMWVEGEVSNLRKQGSGHWYFSLKDADAQISCAMFGARRREGAEALADGAKVRVFAEASVYAARGQLQIIVKKAELAGAGDLQAKFEALKRKLDAEGLFDAGRKKALPGFPQVVGLVTSGTGAALQDMLNVLGRRAPWVQPVLFPVRVQGKGAEREIARAVRMMGEPEKHGYPRCDVLIVGRGGGSIEDLWNFNEEVVARAIAECPIPVVSAVGHEIDFTIADFVADLRAPTPSAAAELVAADGAELLERLAGSRRRMARVVEERMRHARTSLDGLKRGVLRLDGERLLRERVMRVDAAGERMRQSVRMAWREAVSKLAEAKAGHRAQHPLRVLERQAELVEGLREKLARRGAEAVREKGDRLEHLRGMLRALGPESAFQRGFSITMDEKGAIVRSVAELKPGDVLKTKFSDGEAVSRVEE